ncbi:COG6 [Scenedesmus sp. PABB004]|nr:COG6 [Scenedesmus sp. PABB004]
MRATLLAALLALAGLAGAAADAPWFCHDLDCPSYKVVANLTALDAELRAYAPGKWASTVVSGVGYDKAVATGFWRLFKYISGANVEQTKIEMTAPVTVRVTPGAGPACENNYTISFFVPSAFQAKPPTPSAPEVFIEPRAALKVYVRSFGGWATGATYLAAAASLTAALEDAGRAFDGSHFFTAGYDSPFRLRARHNERRRRRQQQRLGTQPPRRGSPARRAGAMAATSALAPGLARKVKKILEIKTESPELVAALGTLSAIYADNTPAARRGLRATIEQRGLAISRQFLVAAEGVTAALDDVQAQLDGVTASCAAITSALAGARATAGGLLAESDKAARELAALDARRALVEQFLDKYQLTPEEAALLQAGQVGPEFFAALSRLRAIHEHCRGLLRSHHQRAGLELMDHMAAHQEAAYEHLCRWVQAECRRLGEVDAPEVEPSLAAAVAALRDRPVLYKYCAEEVASARHGALFQRFIVALTRGGPGGLPRPIEIHAHDPRRYAADMLAWVHQALCGEREFVVALFGGGDGDEPGAAAGGGDALGPAALLDKIFESLCRPLKVRIEQVLMMSPPLLLCYQLGQLAAFYASLIAEALGPRAALTATVAGCRDLANRTFMEQLKASGDRLLRAPPQPPADLSPPQQVTQTLSLLGELVTAFEGSMHASAAQPQAPAAPGDGAPAGAGGGAASLEGEEGLARVLGAVLEPLLAMVSASAEALSPDSPARLDDGSKLDPTAHKVFTINCLAACQATLALRPAAAARAAALAGAVNAQLEALVAQEVGRLLARSGLAEVVERVRLYKASPQGAPSPPASDPALSLGAVAEALRRFFVAVSSPDALPEFAAIQSPRLRGDAVARVAASLVAAYEEVHALLDDPTAGYAEAGGSAAVRHTPAQVRTILGVL